MPSPPFEWNLLLGLIAERKVIPIVGQDLLRIEVDGRGVHLYRYLAERLAAKLGVEMPDATSVNPLHETAARHLAAADSKTSKISVALCELMSELHEIALPQPLLKLAAIRKLRLFLTTTFDPLLKRALDQDRYQRDDVTEVLTFTPTSTEDIQTAMPDSGTTIFHLFGKIGFDPADFAVHEDDVIEFMSALQSTATRPKNLFFELERRHLLIIGSGFDDWLTRFFIRSLRQRRLWLGSTSSPNGFVADDRTRCDKELLDYLDRSKCVQVFPGSPIEFVDQLHERWQKWDHETTAERTASPKTAELKIVDGCVFISYASENRSAVEKIVAALRAVKLDVFYDQTELRSGDAFGPKILMAIQRSAAFVPIISQDAVAPGPRYVKSEWNHRVERSTFFGPADTYFLPILLDDVGYDDERVHEVLRRLTWERMPSNGPSEAWVERVRRVARQNRDHASS